MPLVFIPWKGEMHVFMRADFVLPFCSLVRHCGWVWRWIRDGMDTQTSIVFFLLWKELSCFSSQMEFSCSWRMTQAEKFPKHLKSENLCLEPMEAHAFQMERPEGEEAEAQRKVVGRWKARGKPELWITSDSLWTRPGLWFALQAFLNPKDMQACSA